MEKRIPQAILLPRTEDSFPWGAADRQLVPTYLEKYGYEEEEYLYSGEADVYTLKDGQAQVKLSNAPYTTVLSSANRKIRRNSAEMSL